MAGILPKNFMKILDYILFLIFLRNHLQTHNNLSLQGIYCILVSDLVKVQGTLKAIPLGRWQLQELEEDEMHGLLVVPAEAEELLLELFDVGDEGG